MLFRETSGKARAATGLPVGVFPFVGVLGDPLEPLGEIQQLLLHVGMAGLSRQAKERVRDVAVMLCSRWRCSIRHSPDADDTGSRLETSTANHPFPTFEGPETADSAVGSCELPRLTAPVSISARCAAVLMIAVCEKAWGKLPRSRFALGSYSSDMRPRSLHSASSVSAWVPIFQGIDQAKGTNDAAYLGTLSANALRVDLQQHHKKYRCDLAERIRLAENAGAKIPQSGNGEQNRTRCQN